MLILTEDAVMLCRHELGRVSLAPSQNLVTVAGRKVLVEPNPEGRPIAGCPNLGATIKPCTATRRVRAGYSAWLRIAGQPVCLDTVVGFTDGTPPDAVEYFVRSAGQPFVEEKP